LRANLYVPSESKSPSRSVSPSVTLSTGSNSEKLATLFDFYCKYAPASTALDNVKFFKCCSDLQLIDDRSISRADIDLIFTKVKSAAERRISLAQFEEAMLMIARKRSGGGDESQTLEAMLESTTLPSKPAPPKPTKGSIFDKLTDTSQYTGAHKERFDAAGRGRGLDGRDSVALSGGGVGVYHGGAVHNIGSILRPSMQPSAARTTSTGSPVRAAAVESKAAASPVRRASSSKGTPTQAPSPAARSASSKGKSSGGSIFDRLTDSSQYTGAHKARFDSSGKGRGLMGRDSGGVDRTRVTSIAQILRN